MKRIFFVIIIAICISNSFTAYSQTDGQIHYTATTSGTYQNYWCRIASMQFISGYQDFSNAIELLANGSSTSNAYWGKLVVRCKRQSPDPNGPPTNFQMHLFNSNLGADNIKAVQNNNVVDIYVRIPSTYTRVYFKSIINGSSTLQFFTNQSLSASLPPGDNTYIAKEANLKSEHLVAKNIETTEVKVDLSSWSDFVFEQDYDLKSLQEVEEYINQHGHLPDIPSAKDVEENGISLGAMDAKLLQKIE